MNAVTKEDVARLHSYLVVPIAVGDALQNAAPLDEETQYGLHMALSEIDPDSALLAIACSARRIAHDFVNDMPMAAALKIEADHIINDYGPEWLAHYHDHPVMGDDLYDLLKHVPEDLESLAELLENFKESLRDPQDPAFGLCTILSIQARAHMDIASYVISELEADNMEFGDSMTFDGVCRYEPEILFAPEQPVDNVVLFPIHRRR